MGCCANLEKNWPLGFRLVIFFNPDHLVRDLFCVTLLSADSAIWTGVGKENITVGFREIETTVFDPASVFLSTH